jgi:hypothetical protein
MARGRRPRGSRNALVPAPQIDHTITILRGQTVMLDADLATLYGVTTKALNQAVKRNAKRFPADFKFQLAASERDEVVTKCDHLRRLKFSSVRPWAFTEHGALMAASVLNSSRAVQMSIFVIRAFVRLRDLGRSHSQLADKLDALEQRVTGHDVDLERVFAALRKLIHAPRKPVRQIGFAAVTVVRSMSPASRVGSGAVERRRSTGERPARARAQC